MGGAVGGALAIFVLYRGVGPARYQFRKALQTGRTEVKRLANIGVPSGLEEVQFMLAFLVYTRLVSGFGTAAMAALATSMAMLRRQARHPLAAVVARKPEIAALAAAGELPL